MGDADPAQAKGPVKGPAETGAVTHRLLTNDSDGRPEALLRAHSAARGRELIVNKRG